MADQDVDEKKLLDNARKLPPSEQLAHKNWKVRQQLYDDIKDACGRASSTDDGDVAGYGAYLAAVACRCATNQMSTSSCCLVPPPQVLACLPRQFQTPMQQPKTEHWKHWLHTCALQTSPLPHSMIPASTSCNRWGWLLNTQISHTQDCRVMLSSHCQQGTQGACKHSQVCHGCVYAVGGTGPTSARRGASHTCSIIFVDHHYDTSLCHTSCLFTSSSCHTHHFYYTSSSHPSPLLHIITHITFIKNLITHITTTTGGTGQRCRGQGTQGGQCISGHTGSCCEVGACCENM